MVIRSTDPGFTPQFRARVNVASGEERTFAFAGGGPIVADQLALRLAVEKKEGDGFIYNPTLKRDIDAIDNLNIRGKLLFTPSAARHYPFCCAAPRPPSWCWPAPSMRC